LTRSRKSSTVSIVTRKEADFAIHEQGARELCTLTGGNGAQCVFVQFPDKRVAGKADADIDADGAPFAYNPQNTGLDDLSNAGHPGNWYGVVTDRHGTPVTQGPNDPAPGYYVSATAYKRKGFSDADPRCYLDSASIPFIVVESFIRRRAKGTVLGCMARVTNTKTGQWCWALVGDTGPLWKIGEISIACADRIGVNKNPRYGGESENVIIYEFWPDTPAVVNGETFDLIPILAA
jgi:hypothetical protein